MKPIARILTAVVLVAIGGMALARPEKSDEHARVVASYNLKEKFDGNDATVTMVQVTLGPGQAGTAHRHPGPAFVYVIEGTYELGIDDQPTKIYKAGESFQEPSGCIHRVSRNPAASGDTRLIAFLLHPRSARDILTPVEH
jgi:quercetin dioxygenase-like cupin family protein